MCTSLMGPLSLHTIMLIHSFLGRFPEGLARV
uniref:Uncharacterized protein n=1 Tax=Anguilla anguilla TaxID=7936 RepID=A0A0E9QI94_ANGAN